MKSKRLVQIVLGVIALIITSVLLCTVLRAEAVGTLANVLAGLTVLLAGAATTLAIAKGLEESAERA